MVTKYKIPEKFNEYLGALIKEYHNIIPLWFTRCSASELEFLIAEAFKRTGSEVTLLPKKSKDGDLIVSSHSKSSFVQVKSGKITRNSKSKEDVLTISGYRLGRFKEDLSAISNFLNAREGIILSVPLKDKKYHVSTIDFEMLKVKKDKWNQVGKAFEQKNEHGVLLRISPSMSWQVWWYIPTSKLKGFKELST